MSSGPSDTLVGRARRASTPDRSHLWAGLTVVLLLASALAGCTSKGGFTAQIVNLTDWPWTVTVSLVATGNGTESYNRTFDVDAQETIRLSGFPPWIGNFTAYGRLDDGRNTSKLLPSERFCPACTVGLHIEEGSLRFVTSVVD